MTTNSRHIANLFSLLRQKGMGVARVNRMVEQGRSLPIWDTYENGEEQLSLCAETTYIAGGRMSFLAFDDNDNYPEGLREMLGNNRPTVLSMIGNTELLRKRSVGMGGSRNATPLSLEIARDCVSQLTRYGRVIVSGYANGVDMESHRTALLNDGETIMVLAEGLDSFRIKPELRDLWDWERILVVSEFLPEERWSPHRAMRRNSTVIGLSEAMIIVEAGETGGSLDAGLKTIDARKPLLVPKFSRLAGRPYPVGNDILISAGAVPLMRSAATRQPNLSSLIGG